MLADLVAVGARRRLSLGEVVAAAPALTRVDRKYLVPVAVAQEVLDGLYASWGLLVLPGPGGRPGVDAARRTTHYRSTYFDSVDLATARAHVQGRRRRWKARSRLYVEDGLCRTEVKAKDGRGRTVKTVTDASAEHYGRLTLRDRDFVTSTLAGHAITVDALGLRPSMEIAYERMTLARVDDLPARMTLDWGVTCVLGREQVWLDQEHVLVETKGDLQPSDADRLLAVLGHRPRAFSKYTAAAALLHPAVPDNDVRRLRGTILHRGPVAPARDVVPASPVAPTSPVAPASPVTPRPWSLPA